MRKIPTVKIKCINGGKLSLQVTLPCEGEKRLFKNLGIEVNPGHWDSKKEQVDPKKNIAGNAINREISDEKHNLIAAFEEDRKAGIAFTEDNVRRRMMGLKADNKHDFYAFATEQIDNAKYSKETIRTYESEITKMKAHSPTLLFSDINYKWLQGYENYMRKTLHNHDNTVWKSFKFMKTMCNTALKVGGIIEKNPLKDYDTGKYKQGIPAYLEWAEMQAFHSAVKTKPMTDHNRLIGYYALLSCYSGLRFSDAVNFDYSKKVIHDASGRRLVLNAQKNGEIVSIIFTKYISEVVDYIKDKPLKITNQEFNEALGILIGIAEITKKDISSHSFRHSFAMRCAELGMSIDEVQRLLGHNKRSSTEIYFRIKGKRLDDAMSKW